MSDGGFCHYCRKSTCICNQWRKRTEAQFRQSAHAYIEDQLDVCKRYGHAQVLSVAEYYRLENKLVGIIKQLWIDSGGEVND